jgi:hypothetical protein
MTVQFIIIFHFNIVLQHPVALMYHSTHSFQSLMKVCSQSLLNCDCDINVIFLLRGDCEQSCVKDGRD